MATKTRKAPPALRRTTTGTGIAAGTRAARATSQGAEMIPISQIATNPTNPRIADAANAEAIEGLADSIAELGVLQPVLLVSVEAWQAARPNDSFADTVRWVAIAGNQRLAAATKAQLDQIPAIVRDELATAEGTLSAIAAENGSRTPLSPLAEAGLFAELVDAGLSQRKIAKIRGCSSSHVTKRLKLLELPDEAIAHIGGALDVSAAVTLANLDTADQAAVWDRLSPTAEQASEDTDGASVVPRRIDADAVTAASRAVAQERTTQETYDAALARGAKHRATIPFDLRLWSPTEDTLAAAAAEGTLLVSREHDAVVYGQDLTAEQKAAKKKEVAQGRSDREAEKQALEAHLGQAAALQTEITDWLTAHWPHTEVSTARELYVCLFDRADYALRGILRDLAVALKITDEHASVYDWENSLDDDTKADLAPLIPLAADLAESQKRWHSADDIAAAQQRARARTLDKPSTTQEDA